MYMYIYLNFVSWFLCIQVLLVGANKNQSKENFARSIPIYRIIVSFI